MQQKKQLIGTQSTKARTEREREREIESERESTSIPQYLITKIFYFVLYKSHLLQYTN